MMKVESHGLDVLWMYMVCCSFTIRLLLLTFTRARDMFSTSQRNDMKQECYLDGRRLPHATQHRCSPSSSWSPPGSTHNPAEKH